MTKVVDTQNRADALAGALDDLTTATARDVVGRLAARLADVRVKLTGAWIKRFGDLTGFPPALRDADRFATFAVAELTNAMDDELVDTSAFDGPWQRAYGLGVDHALDTAPRVPHQLPDPKVGLANRALAQLSWRRNLTDPVAEQAARALPALRGFTLAGQGFPAVQIAIATATRAVRRIEATVAFEMTAAAAAGVSDVATSVGAGRIWVAERSGCLHCLAYVGQTTWSAFPAGLTFDTRPTVPPGVLNGPPLHPNCRCSLELWDPSDTELAAGLKREARRSVVKGWSGSDGLKARLGAAERLLAAGAALPKTVEERARRDVKRGSFSGGKVGNG